MRGDLEAEASAIAQLAREASIELNVQDLPELDASRAYLAESKRVYVSYLPKQSWQDTLIACRRVKQAGFTPIPHLPVRLIETQAALDRLFDDIVRTGSDEVLLIAGDYAVPRGPYATVADVLRTHRLNERGLRRVSFAGHPEGHPKVALAAIRSSEVEKAQLAAEAGLATTFLTQFFFEARPFFEWVAHMRNAGVESRLIAGLSGPASSATLFKLAMRCGVGPSIRALGARPSSFVRLLGEHGPEEVVRDLATARSQHASRFDGVHFFGFGGYLRTCAWLRDVAEGRFTLDDRPGFEVE